MVDLVTATKLIAPAATRTIVATVRNKPRGDSGKPTDDPGYAELLELMRKLLLFVCYSTIEDLHAMTSRHSPAPSSVVVTDVQVPPSFYPMAALHVEKQLGPANLDKVGRTWWQWRLPGSVVEAQWVEMKEDMLRRKEAGGDDRRVMFYLHGGAYFLGGIGHDNQIQRHARKLKGRCFAPRYRLAPQFPFPCAVQDVLSAYLYLITLVDPCNIVIAGDSAGGGLCVALLLILRDQDLPMPAGASLISPWVDLTHSFPSITTPTEFDYVPSTGFHAKPTVAWPPPSPSECAALGLPESPHWGPVPAVVIDGAPVVQREQVQMYAMNQHLQIPLVSGVLAASLGGFCPCQVVSGGGELLRDEQMYLAHKMADPPAYPPGDEMLRNNGETMDDVKRYPPTDVQFLVFDDGPHAAPTLGHCNIAKHEYRAIACFSSWALSRASGGDEEKPDEGFFAGQAGKTTPPMVDHISRHRVDKDGKLYPLEPREELPPLNTAREKIGYPNPDALKGFLAFKKEMDTKFAKELKKAAEQRRKDVQKGYVKFPDGEIPPPSALAGRRVVGEATEVKGNGGGVSGGMFTSLLDKIWREKK